MNITCTFVKRGKQMVKKGNYSSLEGFYRRNTTRLYSHIAKAVASDQGARNRLSAERGCILAGLLPTDS